MPISTQKGNHKRDWFWWWWQWHFWQSPLSNGRKEKSAKLCWFVDLGYLGFTHKCLSIATPSQRLMESIGKGNCIMSCRQDKSYWLAICKRAPRGLWVFLTEEFLYNATSNSGIESMVIKEIADFPACLYEQVRPSVLGFISKHCSLQSLMVNMQAQGYHHLFWNKYHAWHTFYLCSCLCGIRIYFPLKMMSWSNIHNVKNILMAIYWQW